MVTPFRFRAVTSRPNGKWRSIFLTGGLVRNFLSASLSSSVPGDVLSFLEAKSKSFHACRHAIPRAKSRWFKPEILEIKPVKER